MGAKGGGLSKEEKTLIDSHNSVAVARGQGVGEAAEGEGMMLMEGDLTRGLNAVMCYRPETSIILLTCITPINSIKKRKFYSQNRTVCP